jgi:hypothetical protein
VRRTGAGTSLAGLQVFDHRANRETSEGTDVAPSSVRSSAVKNQLDETRPGGDDPHATLERALIEEFLDHLGYSLQSLSTLPEAQQRAVMQFAATYATLRLSEIEARARYLHEVEGR